MLASEAEADDAVQEIFIHLWEQREKLDNILNIKAYVLQATRMRCIDIIRAKKNTTELHGDATASLRDIADDDISDEVELTERRSALLHSMLDDLPERQRKIVQMRYLEDKEITEIGETLKMTPSNIYTTLSRTLQTLRDKLKSHKI